MARRLCTLAHDSLPGRLIGYVTGSELGFEGHAFRSAEEAERGAGECDLLLIQESVEGSARLVRKIVQNNPELEVIVLGTQEGARDTTYYEAGAVGYIPPGASEDEALEHVRATTRGETLLTPAVARKLVRRVASLARALDERSIDPDRCSSLTGREREVCALLSEGLSNGEIAGQLGVAPGTVKSHTHNIYEKLDVDSRHVASALYRIWTEDRQSAIAD